MNVGIILAAGIGSRFESSIPKQYMKLNGREIISYSINAFKKASTLDEIVVVLGEQEYQEKIIEKKYSVKCIQGGNTRNISLNNALAYISKYYPNCQRVFIHEAARPFIKPKIIDEYIELLDKSDGVITVSPITDSLGYLNNISVDRQKYSLIQAPECFWFTELNKHFNAHSSVTGTVHQLPEDAEIIKYTNFRYNLKITYPEDLFIAEQLVKINYFKRINQATGNYDKKKYLIFGGTGGIGSQLLMYLEANNLEYKAPSSYEIDLEDINIKKIKKYLGDFEPDVIINTAGAYASDSEGILENYERIMNVNFKSNIVLLEYAKTLRKQVNIVLVSSSSSTKGRENLTIYSASKVALNSIVESLSTELSEIGVLVNVIVPEKTDTPLIKKLHSEQINEREMLQASEVVRALMYYANCQEYGQLVHLRKGM